ncbi:Ger(x)C family spore germination protein [Longirhabdus pacifica]|uniref:Ger(x)C family spore germination protein n=1 Tax=Longirhabdus pacifica TaxID=2305227 RepID=UPI001008F37D|nr:Ger(x)C family spore germination protein [Longirhabdus pacifica]
MKSIWMKIIVFLFFSLTLSGCWQAREAEIMDYVSAVGIDYKDGQFEVYTQMLSFTVLSKQEGGGSRQGTVPISIAKGTGKTVNNAINNLYSGAPKQIFWGHTTAMILSEGVMKEGLKEMIDLLNRHQQIRYSIWVYGTDQTISDLFFITPTFEQSPLYSILHNPIEPYVQRAYIKPIKLHELIAQLDEPGMIGVVPYLNAYNKEWLENEKAKETLFIDGVYAVNRDKLFGKLLNKDLSGLPWMGRKSFTSSQLQVYEGENPAANVSIKHVKYNIKPIIQGDDVKFNVDIVLKGEVSSLLKHLSLKKLQTLAEERVEKQVFATYHSGIDMDVDIYQLMHTMYKKDPKLFHQLVSEDKLTLNSDSLQSVDVSVDITFSGKYKYFEEQP